MGLIGRILGCVGIAVNASIYLQNNQKRILFFKLLSDAVWMVHYFSIGALSGGAVAMICIIRELVFILVKKNRKVWLILFLLVSAFSGFVTYENIFSLLPGAASLISVISFWQKNPFRTKVLSLPISTCMGTYSFVSGSLSGVCNEILTMICSVIGIAIFIKERKVNKMKKLRIGVINWDSALPDDTYFGYHTANSLGDEQFSDRVPYYAERIDKNKISFDNRKAEDYDRELSYAREAGIDYFAYVWYPKEGSLNHKCNGKNDCSHKVYELRNAAELYLKSKLKDKIGFCAILSLHPFTDNDLLEVAKLMKEPFYEKIDGRPLVYIFGGCRNSFVLRFKEICKENGVKEPYAVALADNMTGEGIDALSAYATCTKEVTRYCDHIKDVLDGNDKRSQNYNSLPFFSLGWNPSPRIKRPVPWITYKDVDYAPSPTAEEIVKAGKLLCENIKKNRKENTPSHILTFAWNEFEEGGWLCPTKGENGIDISRIKAFRTVADYLRKNL